MLHHILQDEGGEQRQARNVPHVGNLEVHSLGLRTGGEVLGLVRTWQATQACGQPVWGLLWLPRP